MPVHTKNANDKDNWTTITVLAFTQHSFLF